MSRPLVFISYSHKDEIWKDRVATQLGVSQQQGLLDLWHDRLIAGGDDWYEAIVGAIDSGCVAILLVSAHSLTSDFIKREEIPRILQLRDEGRMRFFPIVISSCDWEAVDWLKRMQLRPVDGRALDLGADAQINAELARIAKEIRLLINRLSVSAVTAASTDGGEPQYRRIPTLPAPKLFVGRREHLVEIEKRLRSNGVIGLISLRGTAGVGKSALALESAYRFASLFPDGRYWVDLRGGDAANAARALLRDLGVADLIRPDSDFHELCDVARAELAGRRALVILDNAEAIDPGHLERLTDLCATTIVTSRVSIDPTMEITVDRLEDEDALELLRERGVNIEAERDDALKLVVRLGGLALALEITARRMAAYNPRQSCAQALAELDQSRRLVEAIRLPLRNTREDNIVEAFALSYRKLNDEMKAAFHALGLCAESGAPVEAVARMLDLETTDVHDLLLALAMWSLAEFSGQRAVVHPLLHSYAEMCARAQSEQAEKMIERHVRYFGVEIGGAFQQAINEDKGVESDEAMSRVDREVDNVMLAQTRALDEGFTDHELAVELTDDLTFYWRLRDEPKIFEWLLRVRELAKKTGQKQKEANVLQAIGDVQSFRKEMDAALASYDEALALFKQVGSKLGQANVQKAIGDVQSFRDEKDAALASYDEALGLFKQVGDKLGQANVQKAIGDVQSFRDEKDAALASYDEALALFKQVGSKLGQANVLQAIGDVQSFRKEMDAALASYDEALALFKQVGSKLGQANVQKAIGDVQSFRDEKDAALASYDEALGLFKQVGDKLGQANVQKAIGDVQSFRDEKDAALASYDEALALFKQVGSKLGQANVLQAIGDVQSFRKEMDAALASYDEALALFKQVGSKLGQANVQKAIGDVQSFRDEKDAALASYDEALALFKQVGDKLGQANVQKAIGDVQSFRDEKDAALASYDEALGLFKQVGDKLGQANVQKAIGDVQSFRDEKDAALASYDEALALFKQVGSKLGQANVLQAIGDVQSFRKEMDAALASYDEALALFKQVGSKLGQANVQKAIGDVQSFRDEKDAALASYDEALGLFKQVGDKLGQANVQKAIGDVQSFRDEKDAALASYDEALALFKQVGSKLGQANVLQAIGDVQSFRDEKDAALASYDEALALFKQVGSKLGQANVLQAIGDVQSFRDEKDAALASYDEALGLFKQVGSKLGQANVQKAIGDVQSFRDEKDAALASYDEALALFKQVGDKLGQANVQKAIGDVQSFRKEMDAALASYDEALTLFNQVGAKLGQANVILEMARMDDDEGRFRQALELYETIRDGYSIARCNYYFGLSLMEAGDVERAKVLLGEAREGWAAINFDYGVRLIDESLARSEESEDAE